ncbi:MAG: hypothetical protein LBU32_09290 [Clostridiales bacterium]|jgi:hypothetical protein|nr:hypothetical protein [Clostridiales bacterium]
MKMKLVFALVIAMAMLTACSDEDVPAESSPAVSITSGEATLPAEAEKDAPAESPASIAAEETEWPLETESMIAAILLISQSITPANPEDAARQAAYNGTETIDGVDCHSFSVYTDLSGRYENLGTYFKKPDEEVYYYYDAIKDSHRRIIIGDKEIFLEGDEPPVEMEIDNLETCIGMTTQEYTGGSIAEIPIITYDGQQAALEEYNWKNPDIESINDMLKNGIQQEYNEFITTADPDIETIEIRSYPFTTDDMLQVVVTHIQYPIYGTDGELFTINFDKVNNLAVYAEDIMAERNLTEADIAASAAELFEPESAGATISNVAVKGFLIIDEAVSFLLEANVDYLQAETWTHFFSFSPDNGRLVQLNAERLFDPEFLDEFDPPLSYQQTGEIE